MLNQNLRPDSTLMMKGALALSPEAPLQVVPIKKPRPAKEQILVKLVASGICHTDIMVKSNNLCSFPIILGHEGAGVIEEVGEGVEGYEPGDHVILTFDACGHCQPCQNNHPAYCHEHGPLNFSGERKNGGPKYSSWDHEFEDISGAFFQQSSFATHCLSHPNNTVKVSKDLPLETLAPLGCGVQTGAGTVFNTLDVAPGSSLAIFGVGCVGLAALLAAKCRKASPIVAIDLNPQRLQLAQELGATQTFNPKDYDSTESFMAAIREATPGSEGLNFAIDTTGQPRVLRQAFDSCGIQGRTAMIAPGVPGTEVSIEMLRLLPKKLEGVIQGDANPKDLIPHLIELWQQGQFPFDQMITFFSGLDALNEAIAATNRGDVVKAVIQLGREPSHESPH